MGISGDLHQTPARLPEACSPTCRALHNASTTGNTQREGESTKLEVGCWLGRNDSEKGTATKYPQAQLQCEAPL